MFNNTAIPAMMGGWPHYWWGLMMPLALLDLVLRGFALWKSARSGKNGWFIALLIVNSLGILPAIYLYLNREVVAPKSNSKPKKK